MHLVYLPPFDFCDFVLGMMIKICQKCLYIMNAPQIICNCGVPDPIPLDNRTKIEKAIDDAWEKNRT